MMFIEHTTVLALMFAMERLLSSNVLSRNELMLFVEGIDEDKPLANESTQTRADRVTVDSWRI